MSASTFFVLGAGCSIVGFLFAAVVLYWDWRDEDNA